MYLYVNWKGHKTFPLYLTYKAASYFVNAFAEKVDRRKTSPISRVMEVVLVWSLLAVLVSEFR